MLTLTRDKKRAVYNGSLCFTEGDHIVIIQESRVVARRPRNAAMCMVGSQRRLPLFRNIANYLLKTATHPYSMQNLGMFPLES